MAIVQIKAEYETNYLKNQMASTMGAWNQQIPSHVVSSALFFVIRN